MEKDADTSPGALQACVAMCLDKTFRDDSVHALLEPLMKLDIELPSAYVGDVLSDLTVRRRAQIRDVIVIDGNRNNVNALVPLATILGYASSLRSITQGEGAYTMEYHSHGRTDPSTMP